eukprot:scaffold2127_cov85-Cylindrotheca_fusiformis.AAC.4
MERIQYRSISRNSKFVILGALPEVLLQAHFCSIDARIGDAGGLLLLFATKARRVALLVLIES